MPSKWNTFVKIHGKNKGKLDFKKLAEDYRKQTQLKKETKKAIKKKSQCASERKQIKDLTSALETKKRQLRAFFDNA